MKVVCAWCQRAGHFKDLRETEPRGDEISHGICDEHVLFVMAESRRRPKARSSAEPVGSGWQIRANGGSRVTSEPASGVVLRRLLVIVSRDAPGRFAYLKHLYGPETVEVVIDRRVSERRRRRQLAVNERRRATRRRWDLNEDLNTFGWSLATG